MKQDFKFRYGMETALVFLIMAVRPCFPENHHCEIIKYSTHCVIKDGSLITTDSVTMQINDRIGEEYSTVQIPYGSTVKISQLRAWIEDTTGIVVRKLKKSDIAEISGFSGTSMYEDKRIKVFQMRHFSYPYRLCYTYTATEKRYNVITQWSPMVIPAVSTREAGLWVSLPKETAYKKYLRGVDGFHSDTTQTTVEMYCSSRYDGTEVEEVFAEPLENRKPLVIIVPLHFRYGVEGSNESWKSFGDWFCRLNKGLNDLPENEKQTISQLTAGISDKREIVRTLYHYMQDHTRYINISIGIGGMKTYPASYVAQNKYGDCKALSNYMKTMLEFVGINSNIVLIRRDPLSNSLIQELPCPQFNHALLMVPLHADTVYLENTSGTWPFDYRGCDIQNRKALLVIENNSVLIKIPALSKHDVAVRRTFHVDFSNNEDAVARATFLFKGDDFEQFDVLKSSLPEDAQDRIIRAYSPFTHAEVVDWKLQKPHRDSSVIALTARIKMANCLLPLETERYFAVFPSNMPPFETPGERKLPVSIPYPMYTIDTVYYSLPKGLKIKSAPADTVLTTQFGSFRYFSHLSGSVLKIVKIFELYPSAYPVERYNDFYSFLSSIKHFENQKVVLLPIDKQ